MLRVLFCEAGMQGGGGGVRLEAQMPTPSESPA